MLDQYKCVGMVLIININNITYPAGIKIATSQILLSGGILRRENPSIPSYYLGQYHSALSILG